MGNREHDGVRGPTGQTGGPPMAMPQGMPGYHPGYQPMGYNTAPVPFPHQAYNPQAAMMQMSPPVPGMSGSPMAPSMMPGAPMYHPQGTPPVQVPAPVARSGAQVPPQMPAPAPGRGPVPAPAAKKKWSFADKDGKEIGHVKELPTPSDAEAPKPSAEKDRKQGTQSKEPHPHAKEAPAATKPEALKPSAQIFTPSANSTPPRPADAHGSPLTGSSAPFEPKSAEAKAESAPSEPSAKAAEEPSAEAPKAGNAGDEKGAPKQEESKVDTPKEEPASTQPAPGAAPAVRSSWAAITARAAPPAPPQPKAAPPAPREEAAKTAGASSRGGAGREAPRSERRDGRDRDAGRKDKDRDSGTPRGGRGERGRGRGRSRGEWETQRGSLEVGGEEDGPGLSSHRLSPEATATPPPRSAPAGFRGAVLGDAEASAVEKEEAKAKEQEVVAVAGGGKAEDNVEVKVEEKAEAKTDEAVAEVEAKEEPKEEVKEEAKEEVKEEAKEEEEVKEEAKEEVKEAAVAAGGETKEQGDDGEMEEGEVRFGRRNEAGRMSYTVEELKVMRPRGDDRSLAGEYLAMMMTKLQSDTPRILLANLGSMQGQKNWGGGQGGRWFNSEPVVLHKTTNAFKLGQVRTDDPEEEARQKQFKSILNKLTPENFDKLLPKLLAVEIPRLLTLQGLVDQIFDKALLEPTFSELYALLCQRMQESRKLPQFDETGEVMDEASGVKPAHDFRKTLLAKCQTEFEAGTRARKEHYDETHKVKASEEAEEDPKAKALREAENLQARKRMLGNIKFIGHLFQHKMLIESIMVTCIKTLLANVEEPEPEDVEALCRLLSTVGGMLDTGNNGKMMDVFFIRVQKLRENERLESRIRFMLQDIIELRQRGWQERRKIEGPKKIHEVHADAMRSQSGRSLGGGGRGGFGMPGFSPGGRGGGGDRFGYNDPRGFSGGPMGPPDRFGGPGRDSFSRGGGFSGPRERGGPSGGMAPPALAPRPPPRVEPTMGPRDDGWRGRGDRPAAGGAATPSAGGAAEAQAQAGSQPVSHAETPRESIGADKVRQRAKGTMEEFQSGALKANGVAEEYRDVKQLGGSGGTFLASFVREGITGRGARWAPCLELMQQLAREGMVEGGDLQDAAAELVGSLEGDREDNLHSAEYVGSLLAAVECAGVDLAEVLRGALEAGEEPFEEGDPYGLVECGGGAELLLCTLQDLAKEDKGKAEALWKSIGKPFTDFLSSMDRDDPGRALKKHPDLDFLL